MTRAALALVPLVLLLAGCTPIVALEPAEDAASPLCAEVSVRLPDTVATLTKRTTNAQATGAWGEPTAVILRCGVPSPAPTSALPCVTVEGVDWLRDDANDPTFVFTTYGRSPAVEVIVDYTNASAFDALVDVAFAVSQLPVDGECLSPEDVQG